MDKVLEGTRKYSDLSESEKLEIADLYKDPKNKLEEIANAYSLKRCATVCYVARALGVPLRMVVSVHNRRKYPEDTVKKPVPSIAEQIAETRATLERLLKAQEYEHISFEKIDDTTAVVHGLTENFVSNEGIPKFRAWIEKHFPQRQRRVF